MQLDKIRPLSRWLVAAALTGLLFVTAAPDVRAAQDDTFELELVLAEASDFFGETTHGLATIIEKVFAELGKPNGFIRGEEVAGAFVFGLRYGRGTFHRKNAETVKVFWQGPSVGFDFGGNASRANAPTGQLSARASRADDSLAAALNRCHTR